MNEIALQLTAVQQLQAELLHRVDQMDRRLLLLEEARMKKRPLSPVRPPEPPADTASYDTPPPIPPSLRIPGVPEVSELPDSTGPVADSHHAASAGQHQTTATIPTAGPPRVPPEAARQLEIRMGTYWFVRVGILLLLTGLVFLGNHVWQSVVPQFGVGGKLTALTLAGLILAGGGALLHRGAAAREELRNYSLVLLAGGMATLYYTAYAAHFVQALKVIASPVAGGALLLGMAALIMRTAEKWKSETVALLTVLLSFYTSAMNPIAEFSLFSNLLLASVAVWFMSRHSWAALTYAGMAGSYLAFGFWRVLQGGALVWGTGLSAAEFWPSRGFLLTYWILFTVAFMTGGGRRLPAAHRAMALTANNAAFLAYSAPALYRLYPGPAWLLPLGMGAVLVLLAQLSRHRKDDRLIDGALLMQGAGLVVLSLGSVMSGLSLALCMALHAVVLQWLSGKDPRQSLVHLIVSRVCLFLAIGRAALLQPAGSGLWTMLAVGGTCLGLAQMHRRQTGTPRGQGELHSALLVTIAFFFIAVPLGLQKWEALPGMLTFCGLAALALIPWLRGRIPEYAALSHAFLLAACQPVITALTAVTRVPVHPAPAEFTTAGLACMVMGVLWVRHCFGREQRPFGEWILLTAAALLLAHALPAAAGLPERATWLCLLGVCWLGGGLLLRSPAFAVLSQFMLAAAAFLLFQHSRLPPQAWLLLMIAAGIGAAAHGLKHRIPETWRGPAAGLGSAWRVVSALFLARLLLPAPPALMPGLIALQIIAWAALWQRFRWQESRLIAGLLALFWTVLSLIGCLQPDWHAGMFASALLVPAALCMLRKTPDFLPQGRLGNLLSFAAMLVLAATVSGWAILGWGSGFLTPVWSLLGCLCFVAGLLLRDRAMRLSALVLLALSLGRVFVVDVWGLSTLGRVFSFLALGGVLLALGYVYTRFADRLSRWL